MSHKTNNFIGILKTRHAAKALIVLFLGLVSTAILTYTIKSENERTSYHNFKLVCIDVRTRISARLHAHAQLLRSACAFWAASKDVTRSEWHEFFFHSRISYNLPGIQGIGFSVLIPPDKLHEHIQQVRQEGFSEYTVKPIGKRDIYTSIVYIEPFDWRNSRAFGYDMFSEPTRRKAMEKARDYDIASLSGKVLLKQETDKDIQSGTLMYVPVYDNNKLSSNIAERRKAIKGWVYSPYRMGDLMNGVLGNLGWQQNNKIGMKIYDDSISTSTLMFDSQLKSKINYVNCDIQCVILPVDFNGKRWVLYFTQKNDLKFSMNNSAFIVLVSGIVISFLLSILTLQLLIARQKTESIRKYANELDKLNKDKSSFMTILAHDLRNPFNSILGLLEIAIESIKSGKGDSIERYLELINSSALQTYHLLEDILSWQNAQQGVLKYSPETIKLFELCNTVAGYVSLNAQSKSIIINNNLPTNLEVYADYNMISTIIRNLITNSIKFCNNGGEININAEETDMEVVVSVADNGIGMSREKVKLLFENNQVATTAGTAHEKGTGFGLLLCKEFIKKHGGTISVESVEEKGSTFIVKLPKVG